MFWLSRKVRAAFTVCISLAGARGIPKTVCFKSGREAFDLHCRYGKIDPLRNGCIRLGLIVPGALTADSDGCQSVVVKIADPVAPFLCRGTTAVPNMPPLQGDQLVYWCASRYDPRLCKSVSDPAFRRAHATLWSAAGWLPTAAPHNELTRGASYTPRRFVCDALMMTAQGIASKRG
jgi:hypothetical protein